MTCLIAGAHCASILTIRKIYRFALTSAFCAGIFGVSHPEAQTINFTSIPAGYEGRSIELKANFAGALGVDPSNDQVIYCAVGGFGAMSIAKVNIGTGDVRIVATGPFAAIGGIAPLSATEIVVTDNGAAVGGAPDETTLLLKDSKSRDGDFDDAGEIKVLIAPILSPAPENWSGAQARLVPKRKHSKLKSGSVMIQTADGAGGSELLLVENPGKKPKYATGMTPFFSGFDYNGGFDFDNAGRVIMGTLTGSFTGEVFALADKNGNRRIDAGESNKIVVGESGMADLVVDGENDVLFAGFDSSFFAAIRAFRVPSNPLIETATPSDFASTDSGFLSAIILNSKKKPFEPGVGPYGASLLLSGFTGSFESATNLLVLTPADEDVLNNIPFAIESWPADDF